MTRVTPPLPTRLLLAAASVLLTACASARAPEFLGTTVGPPRPFSPAVRANGFIYLAGQVGTDSTGAIVTGGIQAETRQVMRNIGDVLQRTGSSFDRVVKCTAFLADMREWNAMNEVYVTFFPAGHYPARSAMGVNGLALGARVEIECIAV
ncbi:MAG: RidA family protein [Gemmatimonadaceae bacterium]|nr:RidA family protein [Gemmatimonadaceae bacterium]